MSGRVVVLRPGLLTTVQDEGRWGHQRDGVPVAGPMDPFAHRLANLLAGNARDAATLEITVTGPRLRFECDARLALAGAPFAVAVDGRPVEATGPFDVPAGGTLTIDRARAGARAYLAVAGGGILCPPVLGSRATHLVSHMGGIDGRALVAGDVLPIPSGPPAVRLRSSRLAAHAEPAPLRVLPSLHADRFGDRGADALAGATFTIATRSNRMGYHLDGPRLPSVGDAGDLVSQPIAFGTIQVPPDGRPILLMADRQTTGGYPTIANVITADWPVAGQLAPGDPVTFVSCTRRQAAAALIARERALLAVAGAVTS